ncbi:MAG: hypothetical protein ABJA98_12550 [Acidobacteriota bacterium]
MNEPRCTNRSRAGALTPARRRSPVPIVLWRLRGATDDLRGLVIEASFGYAFGFELDAELVFLHLHAMLDGLIAFADRVEAALLAQGWRVIPDALPSITRTGIWRSSCRCGPNC